MRSVWARHAQSLGTTCQANGDMRNTNHYTTRQLADFIQTQASVKRSDCIAVLDELGDITFEEATDYEAPKVASSNQGGGTNQGGSNTGGDNLGQN